MILKFAAQIITFGKNFTQNFTKITNDIAGVIYHREANSMWKTVCKGETKCLSSALGNSDSKNNRAAESEAVGSQRIGL